MVAHHGDSHRDDDSHHAGDGPRMRPFDLPNQPAASKDPLLTRTDLITIALVGIGIIAVTSVLLVLLF